MEVGFGGAFLAIGVLLVFIIVGGPLLIHYSSRKTTQPSRKTTQHAPRPPLWRRILSLPRTRLGWWAVGLAAPALVSLLPLQLDNNAVIVITALVSALAGGLVGFVALALDQSLLVWVAQVPALYLFAVLASFGQEGELWFIPSVVVFSLWAFMAFGIIWSYRDLPERRSS